MFVCPSCASTSSWGGACDECDDAPEREWQPGEDDGDDSSPTVVATTPKRTAGHTLARCTRCALPASRTDLDVRDAHNVGCMAPGALDAVAMPFDITTDLRVAAAPQGYCPSCGFETRKMKVNPQSGAIDAHNIIPQSQLRADSEYFSVFAHECIFEIDEYLLAHDALDETSTQVRFRICTRSIALDLLVDELDLDGFLARGAPIVLPDSGDLIARLLGQSRRASILLPTALVRAEPKHVQERQAQMSGSLTLAFGTGFMGDAFCQAKTGLKQCQGCEAIQGEVPLLGRLRQCRNGTLPVAHPYAGKTTCHDELPIPAFDAVTPMHYLGLQFCKSAQGVAVQRIDDVSPYYVLSASIWQIKRHLDYFFECLMKRVLGLPEGEVPRYLVRALLHWPVVRAYYCLRMLQRCWN
jgi:hypothetical protein